MNPYRQPPSVPIGSRSLLCWIGIHDLDYDNPVQRELYRDRVASSDPEFVQDFAHKARVVSHLVWTCRKCGNADVDVVTHFEIVKCGKTLSRTEYRRDGDE